MSSYYDVDTILAQEELIPCTTAFDFARLAHLSPDDRMQGKKQHYLSQGSQIKMPLWALEKWSNLGFVKMSLPKHYGRKSRQRLQADPAQANLRKQNERFFLSGQILIDLVERCASNVGRKDRRNAAAMAQLTQQVTELKHTLLVTFMGERFERTLDLMLNGHLEDFLTHHYTKRLDEMELQLFYKGVAATCASERWKNDSLASIQVPMYLGQAAVVVTPNARDNANDEQANKRQRLS